MQILSGSLIKLSERDRLPIPWYHRSPIGLRSGTDVYAVFMAPAHRAVGDLVVSVLDPDLWRWTTTISCSKKDGPGVLLGAFEAVSPLNIALAETATIESGRLHEIRLIVQPDRSPISASDKEKLDVENTHWLAAAAAHLQAGGYSDITVRPMPLKVEESVLVLRGKIESGWVELPGWQAKLQTLHGKVDDVDLCAAVIFADTSSRAVRFVFPRHGALTVRVEHKDRPGAMARMSTEMLARDLNVLSLLTRRSTSTADQAEMVAVVEPTTATATAVSVESARGNLTQPLRVNRWTTTGPISPARLIQSRFERDIVARPPEAIEARIREVRQDLNTRYAIFVSHRFQGPENLGAKQALRRVSKEIQRAGFTELIATPQPGSTVTAPYEVKAKMWAAEAAIVLVIPTEDDRPVSESMAHEKGFMDGQSKEVFFLVEASDPGAVNRVPNLQGEPFAAFNLKDLDSSIKRALRPWLKELRASLDAKPD